MHIKHIYVASYKGNKAALDAGIPSVYIRSMQM